MAIGDGISGPGITSSGTTQGGNTKVSFTRGSITYDNPFLDMTSTFLPKNIKGILRFSAAYAMGDGLVAQCITKLAEYPITKLIYNEDEESSVKNDKRVERWRNVFEKKLKISRVLKQIGMDYYAYGNSIVSINYPFKRMITCPKCKETRPIDGVEVKFKSFSFHAKCPTKNCSYYGKMTAKDMKTTELDKLSIVHWDLMNISIKYNPITGDHFYFYNVPGDISFAIRRGDMDIIKNTRLEVIEAVKTKKQIKLKPDNVFHLKRPGPQYLVPSERGWGIPATMPVMKDIFHNKILKKGNEMIAFDHIVPLRIMFPQGTGDVSPHATINLSSWKDKIEDEIRKWRADPNYVSIVPIPIGMENFSGDAKLLLVTPEIKATEDVIITGMGIIPEIIRGGASWSGSNVSLRVVENTFLNHRNDMHEFIDFVEENISRFFDFPRVNIKMSDFKMADDLEKKKLMLNASGGGPNSLVSSDTATKELGFDPKEEYKKKLQDLKKSVELGVMEAEGQAEAQGAASVINASFQADAQIANQDRLEMNERESQARRDEASFMESEENAHGVEREVDALSNKAQQPKQSISIPNLILIMTNRFMRLAQVDPDEFKIRMLSMKNSTPSLFREVYKNLKEMNVITADVMPDLEQAQKSTPGEIPSYVQGEQTGADEPTLAEQGSDPSAIKPDMNGKPLPEARPPRSAASPI